MPELIPEQINVPELIEAIQWVDQLIKALKWVDQVWPDTHPTTKTAVVHMTWPEWNRLRYALGLSLQSPRNK